MNWIPVSERLPESEVVVIEFYKNNLGRDRRIRACYIHKETVEVFDSDYSAYEINDEYIEEKDAYYMKAGWYEVIDNWPRS